MIEHRLREFEVFAAIVETGSFSAAARKLGCTPSAVSKLTERLENRIGTRLFQRTSRALALTQEGRAFREAADHILNALAEADSLFTAASVPASGTLRVHTTLAFAQHQLAPLLPEFLDRHSAIKLEMVLTSDAADMLGDDIDVSIQVGPVVHSSLIVKQIATVRRLICASPIYLKRRGIPRTPKDLGEHNCLNFFPSSYHSSWPMRATENEGSPSITGNIASNSDNFLRLLACQGLGIARLADFHIGQDVSEGRLISLLEDFQLDEPEPVFAIFSSRRNLSRRVRVFLTFLEHRLFKMRRQ